MNSIFGTMLFICFLGMIWNGIALLAHFFFGVHLPAIDPG